MSLFSELINSTKVKPHKEFYGRYEVLNSYNQALSNNALQKLQLTRLKTMEKSNNRFALLNSYLANAKNMLQQELSELPAAVQESVPKRIMKILNSGLQGNIDKMQASNEQQNLNFIALEQELQSLLGVGGKPLAASIVENLQRRFADLNSGYKTYIQNKAYQAEQVAVQLIAQDKNFIPLLTGQMVDKSGKQLIQDVVVFEKNILGAPLNQKAYFDDKQYNFPTIRNFLTQIKKLKPETIRLTDEMQGALRAASAFALQSKSGLSQHILTSAERNNISLQELGGFIPNQLLTLYNEASNVFKNQSSATLAGWANYTLSKGIALTALRKNEVYYTVDGFVTTSQWMSLHNYLLKFTTQKMKLSTAFLTEKRPINFYSVK